MILHIHTIKLSKITVLRNLIYYLLQTAERVLQDICGTEIKAKFYGNAPIGFYKYKYPKKLNEQGIYGAKIFYFLAKYVDGNITSNVKYQWLDDTELKEVLPPGMQKSISQFMFT